MKRRILRLIFSLYFLSLFAQNSKEEIEIQELVVTATRTERYLKDIPIPTTVISSKTIEKSRIVNFKDFLEQELVGINFSNHGGSSAINMMGLGAKYILFLIDGERLAGETFDNIDYNRININDIERIEIVKGASSALYGSNAIGGVINIITKKPKQNLDTSISTRYGNFNDINTSIFIGTKQKWGSVSLSSSFKNRDPYLLKDRSPLTRIYENGVNKTYSLGKNYIAGYYDYGVNPKASIHITPKIQLDISTSFFFKERNPGGADAKKIRDQYQDYSNSGKLNIQLAENKNLSVSGSYGLYEKFEKYLLLKQENKKYENSIWRGSIIYDQKLLNKHSLIFGSELLSEELLSFMFNNAGTGAKRNAQTYSVFTQQDWSLTKTLTLVTGGRYDYHSEYKGHFTVRLSGMYKLGKNFVIRGGYSGGFRSPTLKELYTNWYHPDGGGFQIAGNTNLKTEKSHNINLSSDVNIKSLNVSLMGQYSHIKDKIDLVWTDSRDTVRYMNLENAKILSAEILATYRLRDNFIIKGGYAFTHDVNKEQQLTRPHTITANLEYTPDFIGKYAPVIFFSGKYFSGLSIYGTDEIQGKYKIIYDPYSIWRLGINVRLPFSFHINAGIDNVFDYKPKFVSTYSSISAGRTFFIGLKWNIKN